MEDQDKDMHVQSTKLNVNWLNFNMPTIAAVAALGVLFWNSAQSVGDMRAQLSGLKDSSVSRSTVTDKKFDEIQMSLATLNNMPYRVGILEQQATAINIRIDRFTETITNTMELIRKDVGSLGTKVEVMSSKIDQLAPEKKAGLTGSPPELVR
jgi:hypothetical protein